MDNYGVVLPIALDQDFQDRTDRLLTFIHGFNVFRGAMVLTILAVFGVFLAINKRRQRFEITIVIIMSLKYSQALVLGVLNLIDFMIPNYLWIPMISVRIAAGLINHSVYASQYIKTCVLIPNLVEKVRLVLERHHTAIGSGLAQMGSVKDFVRIHNEIDKDIKLQNQRYRRINMVFLMVDIALSVLLLSVTTWLQYTYVYEENVNILLFMSVVDMICALLLGFSALYLALSLKKRTGQRPNMCLVCWHIFNTALIACVLATVYIFQLIYLDSSDKTRQEDFYHVFVVQLITNFTFTYVDLFLLYLLYKFTKPMEKLADGRTVASAVLFAHDHSKASQAIRDSIQELTEQRERELIERKHADFFKYVVSQWADELQSSTEVGLEFLDRGSINLYDMDSGLMSARSSGLLSANENYDTSIQRKFLFQTV